MVFKSLLLPSDRKLSSLGLYFSCGVRLSVERTSISNAAKAKKLIFLTLLKIFGKGKEKLVTCMNVYTY